MHINADMYLVQIVVAYTFDHMDFEISFFLFKQTFSESYTV